MHRSISWKRAEKACWCSASPPALVNLLEVHGARERNYQAYPNWKENIFLNLNNTTNYEEEIASLRELVDLQDFYAKRGDSEKVKSLDSEFHKNIYRLAGSAVYYDTLMPLHTKIQKFRKATVESTGKAEQSASEHRAVLDAIASRDEAAAEKAMTAHIASARSRLLDYLRQQEDTENGND